MSLPPWHPENYARRRPYLAVRQKVICAVRQYFSAQDFAEVETPILQVSPGNEVHLQAFKTELRDPYGGPAQAMYLQTSPEFAMKKLLVAGEPRLFQIAHAFRNAERSSRHHSEFTMLEWYRKKLDDDGLAVLRQDCVALVRLAAKTSGIEAFSANGMKCDPFEEAEVLSVPDAFRKYANIDLLATAPVPYAPDVILLREAAPWVRTVEDDTWEDVFFRIMAEKIEPFLGKDRLTFLCDYPISMAALARPKKDDPRLAERFELYSAGYEIANAFDELVEAPEQLRRFDSDMKLKEQRYGERFPIDMGFIAALQHGMPSSVGIALGLDRLVMLCAGTENIEDVLWLPVSSPTGSPK